MGSLKVCDEEYAAYAQAIRKVGMTADSQLKAYFDILKKILDSAVTAGNIYESLLMFFENARLLENTVGDWCTMLSNDSINKYVAEVNEKDEYLYD